MLVVIKFLIICLLCRNFRTIQKDVYYYLFVKTGAATFTTSKNTTAVFLAKSVKSGCDFVNFNWQYLFSTG